MNWLIFQCKNKAFKYIWKNLSWNILHYVFELKKLKLHINYKEVKSVTLFSAMHISRERTWHLIEVAANIVHKIRDIFQILFHWMTRPINLSLDDALSILVVPS